MPALMADLLTEAHDGLREVVGHLDADDWIAATPCSQWNVSQVFRHAVLDQYAFARGITGQPGPDEDQFSPTSYPPADPDNYLEAGLTRAHAAFAGIDPNDPAVPTPWPGTMAAEQVAAACALDAIVHAWDIAVATGQPSPLSQSYAAHLHSAAPAFVEPLRSFYAAPLTPHTGDKPVQALLRYLGRDPAWTSDRR